LSSIQDYRTQSRSSAATEWYPVEIEEQVHNSLAFK